MMLFFHHIHTIPKEVTTLEKDAETSSSDNGRGLKTF